MSRIRIFQVVTIGLAQVLMLGLLTYFLPGLRVDSLTAAVLATVIFALVAPLFWAFFIRFAARLHPILYPILTFGLSGVLLVLTSSLVRTIVPGFEVDGVVTGIWVALGLTAASTIVAAFISIEEEAWFDFNVTRPMVKRYGNPTETDVPGVLFIEIDGLSEPILQRAVAEGHMPTLKRWLDTGTHTIVSWETDLSSQTAAMQAGILHGNNEDVPAYRWYDRTRGKLVMSGIPYDAQAIENRLSNGRGLLANGGASRSNMFSGDAAESLFTFSTLLARDRVSGPGFYLFLLSPGVVARLVTRFFIEMVTEMRDAWRQRRQNVQPRISRRFPYPLLRGFMVSTMQELATYTIISDLLRGVPAIYTVFAGYDDLAHFAGIDRPESFTVLRHTDRHIARLERIAQQAPRSYHFILLSDHGQSQGFTFKGSHGESLEELVKTLVAADQPVFATLESNEQWVSLNAVLSDAIHRDLRSSRVLRRALRRKTRDGYVIVRPQEVPPDVQSAEVVVLGSGSLGLIYFAQAKERLSYGEIQEAFPALIPGLTQHPGIGFVLVNSEEHGGLAIGARGVHFLDHDRVEGEDPLANYGPHAAMHLNRNNCFSNQADILVNSAYDPETQDICSFETQVGHHGGLGGPQVQPFLMHPAEFPLDGTPLVGAPAVYEVLRGWRDTLQGAGALSSGDYQAANPE